MGTPTSTPLVTRSMNQPQQPENLLLGRYRVLARRGTGGFGTVCTCWDTRLQRRVAIKRMPLVDNSADGIGASTVDEVLAEARTACLLAHPNIVSVIDFELDAGYAYLIMEYVDGLNLAELLARVEGGRLTHEECAHILSSCARALAYAHENRVLHMDIKPTNIMIDRMGTVKVADLGMAELGAAAGYGGARGGTVGYMPPEQIEGMLVDERADVFSLASVLWQALTGKNPFIAASAGASLEKIRRGPRIGKDASDLDLDIEDALVRALAPTASDRTSSVDELACELVPKLGDPAEGQASLAELIEQSEKDDQADEGEWGRAHLPFHLRMPQAWAVVERALPALAVASFAVAALPGLSRSGSTIATGLLLGNRKQTVAQFSFLMVLAPILGETFLELMKGNLGAQAIGSAPLAAGFVAAFVVGCLACKFMIEIVKRGKLVWFALYCAAAGTVSILSYVL